MPENERRSGKGRQAAAESPGRSAGNGGSAAAGHQLKRSDLSLAEAYDTAMLDLDGVVYVGEQPVAGVPRRLDELRRTGMKLAFVTNNAARTPQTIARHLVDLGVTAAADDVVTSAQAAARLLAARFPAGSAILVVGGEGLVAALAEHGLRAVGSADDDPVAVVQGFHPDVGWRLLCEGAIALARGLPWIASNTDQTIPTARGLAPGNGALVTVLAVTTGRQPEVAGKPGTPLFDETLIRVGADHPIVVGDRLDTDIEGANACHADSLLVLTGVTDLPTLLAADPPRRPTYVATDLAGLTIRHPKVNWSGDEVGCGSWRARVREDGVLQLTREHPDDTGRATRGVSGDATSVAPGDVEQLAGLRAAVSAAWRHRDAGDGSGGERVIDATEAARRLRLTGNVRPTG